MAIYSFYFLSQLFSIILSMEHRYRDDFLQLFLFDSHFTLCGVPFLHGKFLHPDWESMQVFR